MKSKLLLGAAFAAITSMQTAQAVPVDLELIIGQDVSGSIDAADFALSRQGIEAAFRDATLISKVEDGTIGSIAVTLWDFADNIQVAVDWTLIDSAASANAFADSVSAAARGSVGIQDGQSNLINQSLTSLNTNNFEGTRSVLDIVSEGAQSIDGCTSFTLNCLTLQTARDNFLAGGGTAINALWLNDRDFFGLDPSDSINAFEYGLLNVIGGPGSFQKFAEDFNAFAPAFRDKVIAEVTPPTVIPVPAAFWLFGSVLVGFAGISRRKKVA